MAAPGLKKIDPEEWRTLKPQLLQGDPAAVAEIERRFVRKKTGPAGGTRKTDAEYMRAYRQRKKLEKQKERDHEP